MHNEKGSEVRQMPNGWWDGSDAAAENLNVCKLRVVGNPARNRITTVATLYLSQRPRLGPEIFPAVDGHSD